MTNSERSTNGLFRVIVHKNVTKESTKIGYLIMLLNGILVEGSVLKEGNFPLDVGPTLTSKQVNA